MNASRAGVAGRAASGIEVLREALVTSEQMLEAAQAGDWDSVTRLQGKRARRLAHYAAPPGAGGDVRLLLQRMVDINETLHSLAAGERDTLAARNRQFRQAARATQAYERAAR